MPAEKGVRDGHTDALSGTAVLGGEGHFSLLDTVGDRGEGRSSIRGLLDRGTREKMGRREKSREQSGVYAQRLSRLQPHSARTLWRGMASWLSLGIRDTFQGSWALLRFLTIDLKLTFTLCLLEVGRGGREA